MHQQGRHPPPTVTTSPPVASLATVKGAEPTTTGKNTVASSFAAVAALPSKSTATTEAVKVARPAAACSREQKATRTHPTKRAKSNLVASRASQRAAILSKRRAATNRETPALPPLEYKEGEATPEILRGIDGVKALDLSLGPPSPLLPPLLPPLTPDAVLNTAMDSDSSESGIAHRTDETEADYHEDVWEDGRRLNTREPNWENVFPFAGVGFCRFCHGKAMPDPVVEDTREYECEGCFKLTTLQLIVKHAIRSLYPAV